MLLLIFCPAHPHRPPDQSPPQWQQIRWSVKRWPPSNTAAHTAVAGRHITQISFPPDRCSTPWLETFPLALIALKFRKAIFDHFHNIAHPGRLASCHIISSRFMCHRLSSDITAWACGRLACQQGKIHHHTCLVP
jgi:hypothetical protein